MRKSLFFVQAVPLSMGFTGGSSSRFPPSGDACIYSPGAPLVCVEVLPPGISPAARRGLGCASAGGIVIVRAAASSRGGYPIGVPLWMFHSLLIHIVPSFVVLLVLREPRQGGSRAMQEGAGCRGIPISCAFLFLFIPRSLLHIVHIALLGLLTV